MLSCPAPIELVNPQNLMLILPGLELVNMPESPVRLFETQLFILITEAGLVEVNDIAKPPSFISSSQPVILTIEALLPLTYKIPIPIVAIGSTNVTLQIDVVPASLKDIRPTILVLFARPQAS
jgi:hypothetical protein